MEYQLGLDGVAPTPDGAEWDKDSWCTPPEMMDAVHRFWPGGIDLDPCSNAWAVELDFVRAAFTCSKDLDCMSMSTWRVVPRTKCWLQPPYSRQGAPIIMDWARRWDDGQVHEALALVRLDTSTDHWAALSERCSSIVLFKTRVDHYENGIRASSKISVRGGSNICSAMLLATREDPIARHNALEQAIGDLGWVYR